VGGERRERAAQLGDELVSAHTLAATQGHLTDVLSADRHTVKPWLAGHLEFSPPVSDFAADGFPLLGGRVERLQGQPVAALVYQRHKHTITVYVALAETLKFPGAVTRRGYHLRSWREGDLSFAAVSDVGAAELDQFVARCRTELK
jgi:anti-sigma factor RsiW